MNEDFIKKVKELGPGLYKCGWFKGYISVEENSNKCTSFLWTSSKNTHDPHGHPAVAMSLDRDNKFLTVSKTAINLHLVKDKEEEKYYIDFIISKINQAHKNKFKRNFL